MFGTKQGGETMAQDEEAEAKRKHALWVEAKTQGDRLKDQLIRRQE